MNNSKNEVVEEIAKRWFHKKGLNIFIIKSMIKKYGVGKVAFAGIIFLEKQKGNVYGTTKNTLEFLFEESFKGYEKEMAEELLEMYKKGSKSSLFLFEILENSVTQKSTLSLERLSKEMNKGWKSSRQGDAKKEFIEKYKIKIQNLLNKFKPQLPFLQPQH